MALMRRLLTDAQAKIRKMVEENRQMSSRIEGDIHNPHNEITSLKDDFSDTSRRMEHLNIKPINTESKTISSTNPENSSSSKSSKSSKNFDDSSPLVVPKFINSSSHRKFNAYLRDHSSSSSNSGGPSHDNKDNNIVVDDTNYVNRRKSKKSKSKHTRRRTDLDFHEDTEPPSPTPGPSLRNDFGLLDNSNRLISGLNSNTMSITLENERLKNEVYELRRLLSMQDNLISTESSRDDVILQLHEDLDGPERVEALEKEIIHAKEALDSAKAETARLKNEKFDLINEMKELYEALDDKEKQIRDFIRNYEHRLRENHEMLAQEKADRERERWSLLRHARDEAERSLALAAQLDIKDQQLNEARRQLSAAGYLSDQESIHSTSLGTRPSNGRITPSTGNAMGTVGDRGSCSADSGVRGSSDRESGATSAGGNLSDSTADGTPTITIDNVHKHRQHHRYLDADSISLVSSTAVPHIYQFATPRDCNSPSLSPLNSQSFIRTLDNTLLSKSVEQLSGGPPPDLEPIRRNKNLRSFSSRSGVASTWGSISRVFSRNRHRKAHSPSSHDGEYEGYSRSYSPLTEEGYTEKLRLLREAAHVPMERWRAPTVLAWIEVALGMPQYGPRCAENIKSGKVLLELSDAELESGLRITNPMHRKKLRLAIEEQRNPTLIRYPCIAQLGHTWVCNEWLPDIGLAQYAENFSKNMVDARMLDHLSKKEMEKYLNVTRKFHQVSVSHGVHLLRMVKYDRQALAIRRLQCENSDTDPIVWTNQRFMQWARDIHLEEYADNLKDSGVHGALVVLEPSVNGDTMATALGIPPSRQMIRRHLAAELEQLILPARYDAFSQAEPIYETPIYRNERNMQQ